MRPVGVGVEGTPTDGNQHPDLLASLKNYFPDSH
jgi:hypothetical protein